MKNSSDIATRIKTARCIRGLSMDALVRRLGGSLSKMAISKYERGQIRPSYDAICRLAKALVLKIEYFTQPPLPVKLMGHRFQLDEMTEVEREVMEQIKQQLQIYAYTEEAAGGLSFRNPLHNAAVFDYEAVERCAQRLRRTWELGTQPIVSVYEVLMQHGIRVIEFYAEQKKLVGLSFYVDDSIPFVCINTYANETVERKRFTALHELAHLLLRLNPMSAEDYHAAYPHSDLEAPSIERLAHRFAGAMLVPISVLRNRLGESRHDIALQELISLKNLYGISVAAAIHRTGDVGIMTRAEYRQWYGRYVIPNFMEKGWGHFPIPETADHQLLMELRGADAAFQNINKRKK